MSNGSDFKINERVTLKSGGPEMTVTAVDKDGVLVEWHNGKEHKTARFNPEALKHVRSDDDEIGFTMSR